LSKEDIPVAYLYRGLFLIILGSLWALWERGDITTLPQFGGYLLILFGVAVVLLNVLPREWVRSP